MALADMTEEQVRAAVDYFMGHYEQGWRLGEFDLVEVDPDEWWAKVQLIPRDPNQLRPSSRAHFEARKARWVELMLAAT